MIVFMDQHRRLRAAQKRLLVTIPCSSNDLLETLNNICSQAKRRHGRNPLRREIPCSELPLLVPPGAVVREVTWFSPNNVPVSSRQVQIKRTSNMFNQTHTQHVQLSRLCAKDLTGPILWWNYPNQAYMGDNNPLCIICGNPSLIVHPKHRRDLFCSRKCLESFNVLFPGSSLRRTFFALELGRCCECGMCFCRYGQHIDSLKVFGIYLIEAVVDI